MYCLSFCLPANCICQITELIWIGQIVAALCKVSYMVLDIQLKMYEHHRSGLTTNWYSIYIYTYLLLGAESFLRS